MTFNMRYAAAKDGDNAWRNTDQQPSRLAVAQAMLARHAPDLIGMQEGEDEQLDELFAALPGYHVERTKPSGGRGNENAAFAWKSERLDLIEHGVFALSEQPGPGYWHSTGDAMNPYAFFTGLALPFPRLALWGRFRWRETGHSFLFYTTHFDLNEEPQVRSAALIVQDARARATLPNNPPLAIVCGDFNSPQSKRAWRIFTGASEWKGARGDFVDSWIQSNNPLNDSGTMHDFSGGLMPEAWRIDWILHRGGFAATDVQIVYDSASATHALTGATRVQYPSDHYPVIATLRFP